jgi:hypothetical protein
MNYGSYADKFSLIAENETKRIEIFEESKHLPPPGEYAFLNAYCEDKKCDCRRAMIWVINLKDPEKFSIMNTISYGWEPKAHYKKEFPHLTDANLKWFKGPDLDQFQPQSQYGAFFLDQFKLMLQQPSYSNRIIRHYVQFKWKIGMKLPKTLEPWLGSLSDCGCRSGKKFKFCCGTKR